MYGRATMADVARRAGVSISTVSRVLAGEAKVRPATSAAIDRAVSDLGYRRNEVGRSLRTGSTGVIGLLVDDLGDGGSAALLRGIDAEATAAGYSVLLATVDRTAPGAAQRLGAMAAYRVDGMVIACGLPGKELAGLLRHVRVPCVVIDGGPLPADALGVGTDDVGGAAAAARHLYDLGHRDVAYLRGPAASPRAQARTRGFAAGWLAAAGVSTAAEVSSDGTHDGGMHAVERLLASGWRGTAIACINDTAAIGAMAALAAAGLHVPDDVSVVGYDDLPAGTWVDPTLTTVRPPTAEIASVAVTALVSRLNGLQAPSLLDAAAMPPTLVVRESSAPVSVRPPALGVEPAVPTEPRSVRDRTRTAVPGPRRHHATAPTAASR